MKVSLLVGIVLVNTIVAVAAPLQVAFIRTLQDFLWTYSGVIALVGMTALVVSGLMAADRILTSPTLRLVYQAVHRAIALASVGFLFAHITLQVAFSGVGLFSAIVPIGTDITIVFGVFASNLMILIIATSMLRKRFAGTRWQWVWRGVHTTAYLCWPMAIVHGLTAGRPEAGYVTLGYALCLAAVGAALVVRMLMRPDTGRRDPERRANVVRDGGRPRSKATVIRRGLSGDDEAVPTTSVTGAFDASGTRSGDMPTERPGSLVEDAEFWSSLRSPRSEREEP
ncbi:hypothetical protein CDO52_06040 [Nocardiopsis gilva YIM 90087]|uniref:Ferric oxidoreductase domain-containing protein n=1 Tax=Nocardiopsis gilva YIM 90087 TaxID=1235441 RepID=A0A223S2Q8_9ACTN|nr:hypothetical protein [Nocardiopsis gilva]ASU82411.1 hypothetical protein CDO52_06040 [Nocardiopsis gilva YIM 90087]